MKRRIEWLRDFTALEPYAIDTRPDRRLPNTSYVTHHYEPVSYTKGTQTDVEVLSDRDGVFIDLQTEMRITLPTDTEPSDYIRYVD
jgi:hypothetical protein